MSAYYDVISRAVAALDESTAATRRALYVRARSTVTAQLRTVPKEDFDRQLHALEDAIRRVEQEIVKRQVSAPQQATIETKLQNAENAAKAFNLNDTRLSTKEKTLSTISSDAMTDNVTTRFAPAIGLLASRMRLGGSVIRAAAEGGVIPIERKLGWATNFFIWSALIVLVLEIRTVFDEWSRYHTPQESSLDAAVHFIGYMAGGLVLSGIPYILALLNGLVLRRYKTRIAAALFAVFGLVGLVLGVVVLMQSGIVYLSVASILFFGLYLSIAVWTYLALTPPTPSEMSEELGE